MAAPIITLTTDLGQRDFYVPAVKGYIWSRLPGANIADISHQIKPFRLDEASFVLRGCYADFPTGSIHIVSIDAGRGPATGCLAAYARGHFFLCRDNGIISLIVDDEFIETVIALPATPEELVFPLKNVFAPAAIKIAETADLSILGSPAANYMRRSHVRPPIEESKMSGTVIYIDNMGNAITNIDRESFARTARGRSFRINYNRAEYFEEMHANYNDVPEGERVCLFGHSGLMEIAINKGSCASLLGIKTGHLITIEFI